MRRREYKDGRGDIGGGQNHGRHARLRHPRNGGHHPLSGGGRWSCRKLKAPSEQLIHHDKGPKPLMPRGHSAPIPVLLATRHPTPRDTDIMWCPNTTCGPSSLSHGYRAAHTSRPTAPPECPALVEPFPSHFPCPFPFPGVPLPVAQPSLPGFFLSLTQDPSPEGTVMGGGAVEGGGAGRAHT